MPAKRTLCHFGFNVAEEQAIIRRYAESQNCEYVFADCRKRFFHQATLLKTASMVVTWNGKHRQTPLATALCRRRQIPIAYLEWGLLPQKTTFLVDPHGFCGDSVLCRDLSWVSDADMERLQTTRRTLQQKHPLRDEGYVLVPLQIENDTQVLFYTSYDGMDDLIAEVEAMYPNQRILIRPHPRSPTERTAARAEVSREGDFLDVAAGASVVVGLTSTCLYEAAILGVPTVALGDHPLRFCRPCDVERVLAGILALRVDRKTGDLASVLDRFNVRPRP